MLYVKGVSGNSGHAHGPVSAHIHAPLFHCTSLIECKFKDKITKNFKVVIAEHYTEGSEPLSMGPCACTGLVPVKPALSIEMH